MAGRNKGKRLWKCDECKRRFYLANIELCRAAKPKCPGCGCSRLTQSEEGHDERLDVLDANRECERQLNKKMQRE